MSVPEATTRTNNRTIFSRTAFVQDDATIFSENPQECLVTFLALMQEMHVELDTCKPDYSRGVTLPSGSGAVTLSPGKQYAFKRSFITDDFSVQAAYQCLLAEIIVFHHPLIREHPNILGMKSVGWEVQVDDDGSALRVMPILILPGTKFGNLSDFLTEERKGGNEISFAQRLKFCQQIGDAIEALHSFNMVHGDLKPENALIFKEKGEFIVKVIDFGSSCFGHTENDIVTLSYTEQWVAPEVLAAQLGSDLRQFTINEAKKADIFSLGKLCAWLLFGQQGTVNDFTATTFDLSVEIDNSGIGSQDLVARKAFNKTLPLLEKILQASYCEDPKARVSINWLAKSLYAAVKSWRLHNGDTNIVLSYITGLIVTFKHTLWQYYCHIRILLLGAVRVYWRAQEISKSQHPRDLQVILLATHATFFLIIDIGMAAVLTAIFITDNVLFPPNRASPGFILWTYGLPIILSLLYYRFRKGRRHNLSVSMGGGRHWVPKLFPTLNRVHHFVRLEVLRGLLEKYASDCPSCKSRAALQLALCYRTAFATLNDSEVAEKYLAESGSKNLSALCKEIDAWEENFFRNPSWIPDIHLDNFRCSPAEVGLLSKTVPGTTMILNAEIEGKIESGICITSAIPLLKDLGDIHMQHSAYDLAEEAFQQALNLEMGRKPKRLDVDQENKVYVYAHDLLASREMQDDVDGALRVCNEIPALEAVYVKTRSSLWRSVNPQDACWQTFTLKLHEVDLLTSRDKLTEAVRIGLLTIIRREMDAKALDPGRKGLPSNSINLVLYTTLKLAGALHTSGRRSEAIGLLRDRRDILNCVMSSVGPLKIRALKDSAIMELATFLLWGDEMDVKESIVLLQSLTNTENFSGTSLRDTLILATYSFAQSQNGLHNGAIMTMRQVVDIKLAMYYPVGHGMLGSMSVCAGSLCIDGRAELERLANMLLELMNTYREDYPVEVKSQFIQFVWNLLRESSFDSILMQNRAFLVLLKGYQDLGLSKIKFVIQEYLTFFLLHLGATFEDETYLNEAMTICDGIETSTDRERNTKLRLIAAIRTKRSRLLIKCGFGREHFSYFEDTIEAHRAVKQVSVELYGEQNPESLNASLRLGVALSEIGMALHCYHYVHYRGEAATILNGLTRPRQESLVTGLGYHTEAQFHLTRLRLYHNGSSLALMPLFRKYRAEIRDWVLGDGDSTPDRRPAWHLGDLALETRQADIMSQCKDEKRSCILKDLRIASYEFRQIYEQPWSQIFQHHPDELRSIALRVRIMNTQKGLAVDQLIEARCLNWMATKLSNQLTQTHCSERYRMDLANALSRHQTYRAGSFKLAADILTEAELKYGAQHTKIAAYKCELAYIMKSHHRREDARRLFKEALDTYIVVFGFGHPECLDCVENLIALERSSEVDETSLYREVHNILYGIFKQRDQSGQLIEDVGAREIRSSGTQIALTAVYLDSSEPRYREPVVKPFESCCRFYKMDPKKVTLAISQLESLAASMKSNSKGKAIPKITIENTGGG